MINITSLRISKDVKEINLEANTTTGHKITKLLVWKAEAFRSYTESIDLSSKISGLTEFESIQITEGDLGGKIQGLYYVEITSDEDIDSIILGTVANLLPYYECLLNKTLEISTYMCKLVKKNCDDCEKKVLYINTLLTTLEAAIMIESKKESVSIASALDILCAICISCPSYPSDIEINGQGFGVENNVIINY